MYEEIDMDDLNTLMTPVIAAPASTHPSSSNGLGNSTTTTTFLMDITSLAMSVNSSGNHL